MKNAILIDIDGTCCDSRYPISYLNGERDTNNFETYYRTLDLVQPILPVIYDIKSKVLQVAPDSVEYQDITLVFLTGRTAQIDAVNSTMKFVQEYFLNGITNSKVKVDFYFRPINYHIPALDYKTEKFEMLKSLYNFTHIYEDELSNVKMFNANKQEGCIVHWVRGSYNYALEQQTTEEPPANVVVHSV